MGHLSKSFSHLETKAKAINAAQTLQAETQARLQSQMEIDMQVTQGYMSDVASSAQQLQSTVTETASKIESMTAFARLFGTLFDWAFIICAGVAVGLSIGLLIAVWRLSYKAALSFLVLICKALLSLSRITCSRLQPSLSSSNSLLRKTTRQPFSPLPTTQFS